MEELIEMDIIYLTQSEFDDLLEYSCSMPTGTTLGKQWKRHVYFFEVNGKEFHAYRLPNKDEIQNMDFKDLGDYWLLGRYVKSDKKNYVNISWKRIEIAGALPIDKTIMAFMERGKE